MKLFTYPWTSRREVLEFPHKGFTTFQRMAVRQIAQSPDFDFSCLDFSQFQTRKEGTPFFFTYYTRDGEVHAQEILPNSLGRHETGTDPVAKAGQAGKPQKVFTTGALYGTTAVIVATDKTDACRRLRDLYKRLNWKGRPDPKYVHEVDTTKPDVQLHGNKDIY